MSKREKYVEPNDYIPEDILKELKLGEFAEDENTEKEKERANQDIRDYVNRKK